MLERKKSGSQLWHRARRVAGGELKAHPVRYTARFGACLLLAYTLVSHQISDGHFDPLWLIFLVVLVTLTLARLFSPMFSKGQQVRDWAVEQQEHVAISTMTGKTPEELEKMVQYHLKYGNIAEADRISQKLIAMVDGNADTQLQDAGANSTAPSEQSGQLAGEKKQGLPGWLRNDENVSPGETIEQADKKKLPDWMK